MARRSRRSRISRPAKRDHNFIANRRLPSPSLNQDFRLRLRPLPVIEDRRFFHPLQDVKPAATFSRRDQSRVVLSKPNRPFKFPDVLKFRVPKRVALCVRRKERKEVLHALGRLRSGRGGRKRRNYWSNVSCQ